MTIMKKLMAPALAILIMNLGLAGSVPAKPKSETDAQFAAKVKASIVKLGTGTAARIQVKLRDGTKLKGYVAEAGEDRFVVVDDKTGASIEVAYPQVKQAKGHNLSTGAEIAIAVVVFILAIGLIFGLRGD